MTASRFVPIERKVTVRLDGRAITANEGEPLAQALLAVDCVALARSPKLHRPRGPSCLRGACDGCLARVDGVPNVMTCLVPAREGATVETQNVLGTRTIDLLRVTDWFFPNGIDHHHFLAGVPGMSPLMQTIARRIAGLGVLPTHPRPPVPGVMKSVDAVVVGGGAAGCAAAARLAQEGLGVALVDDGLRLGGSLGALGRAAEVAFMAHHPLDRVDVLSRSVALGIYRPSPTTPPSTAATAHEVLVASPAGGAVLRPRVIILATGAHDGAALFEGNDLPGVVSARAAARLAAEGVAIGARIVLVGEGPFGDALIGHVAGHAEVTRIAADALVRVAGSSRVGGVVVRQDGAERRLRADALALEAQPAPAFELVEQAGGEVRFRDGAFLPPGGHAISRQVFLAGQVRGLPFDPEALARDGIAAAEAALATLR